jgi:hypothetical protein
MRVSMSAIGSLIVMRSPARLGHARDLARERELAETDPAQRKASNKCARPATELAAIVRLRFEARRTLRFDDE